MITEDQRLFYYRSKKLFLSSKTKEINLQLQAQVDRIDKMKLKISLVVDPTTPQKKVYYVFKFKNSTETEKMAMLISEAIENLNNHFRYLTPRNRHLNPQSMVQIKKFSSHGDLS